MASWRIIVSPGGRFPAGTTHELTRGVVRALGESAGLGESWRWCIPEELGAHWTERADLEVLDLGDGGLRLPAIPARNGEEIEAELSEIVQRIQAAEGEINKARGQYEELTGQLRQEIDALQLTGCSKAEFDALEKVRQGREDALTGFEAAQIRLLGLEQRRARLEELQRGLEAPEVLEQRRELRQLALQLAQVDGGRMLTDNRLAHLGRRENSRYMYGEEIARLHHQFCDLLGELLHLPAEQAITTPAAKRLAQWARELVPTTTEKKEQQNA
jgi:hypothetical protein